MEVSPACKRRYQLRAGTGASMPYHPNTHLHKLMQSVAPCRAGSAPKRYGKPMRSAGPDSTRARQCSDHLVGNTCIGRLRTNRIKGIAKLEFNGLRAISKSRGDP